MGSIRLIAFDLDDTLYNSNKEITSETLKALERASSEGIEIVPATGRMWGAVLDNVKGLEFIHYAIILNGAAIFDVKEGRTLGKFEIPPERALTMARVFDDLGVVYDCIIDGLGYMKRECYKRIPDIAVGEWQRKIIEDFRTPIDDMFGFLADTTRGIQKMQIFTKDKALRENLLKALPVVFPNNIFSSSIPNNIEINDIHANKGDALKFLADYLGINIKSTIAFGDGLNDINMIRSAGVGVAMGNACEEVLEAADYVTLDCNNDGVAEGIKKFCFGQE